MNLIGIWQYQCITCEKKFLRVSIPVPLPGDSSAIGNSVQVATICGPRRTLALCSLSLSHTDRRTLCVYVFSGWNHCSVCLLSSLICIYCWSFSPSTSFISAPFSFSFMFLSLLPCLLSSSSSCSSCSMLLFFFPLAAVLFFSLLFSFFLTFFHSFLLFLYYSFSFSILSIFVVV